MIRARFEKISQIFPGCPETVILPLAELAAETAQGTQGTKKNRPCVFIARTRLHSSMTI